MMNDICEPIPFDNTHDIDIDSSDLAEWLDEPLAPAKLENQESFKEGEEAVEDEELPIFHDTTKWTSDDLNDFDIDIFNFDDDVLVDKGQQTMTKTKSTSNKRKKSKKSSPNKRSKQLHPKRDNNQGFKRHAYVASNISVGLLSSSSSPSVPASSSSSSVADKKYDDTVNRLYATITSTELSQVASQETDSETKPASSTLTSLVDLLTGSRSSLTAGLEHSRTQLRTYMSHMLINGGF